MGVRETIIIEWLGVTLEGNIPLPNTFRFRASVTPPGGGRASSKVFERRLELPE